MEEAGIKVKSLKNSVGSVTVTSTEYVFIGECLWNRVLLLGTWRTVES